MLKFGLPKDEDYEIPYHYIFDVEINEKFKPKWRDPLEHLDLENEKLFKW